VWLSFGLRGPGVAYGRGEAQEGFVLLEVAVPSRLDTVVGSSDRRGMSAVVIGMDPHKRSATIEVMAGDERILGRGRFATDAAGYKAMLAYGRHYPERTWAIEGCQGIGRHIANRLLADGEQVVDVPPKVVGAGPDLRDRPGP
jgi:Transposase